jgi:hypothetical protein
MVVCRVVELGGNLHAFGAHLMHSNDAGLFLGHWVPSLHSVGIFYEKILELERLGVLTLVVRKLGGCRKRFIFIGGYCTIYQKKICGHSSLTWQEVEK